MTDNGNGIRELLERQRGLGTTIRDMRRALRDAAVTARHDYINRHNDAVQAAKRKNCDIDDVAKRLLWGIRQLPDSGYADDAIDRRLASIDDRSRAAYALTGIDPLDIGDDGAWPAKETRRVGSLMTGFKLDDHAALPNIERAGAVTLALAETMNADEIRGRVLGILSLAFDIAVIGAVSNGHPDDLSRFLRHEKATGGVKPRYVSPYPWAMPTPRDARPSAPVPGTPTYDVDRALASVNVASYPSENACFAAHDARALDEAFAALRHRIERGIRDDHARRPPKLAESDRELLVGKSRTARAVADAFMDNHRPEMGALAFAGVDIARLIVDLYHDDMFVQFLGASAQGEWLGYVDGPDRWPTLAMLSGSIAEWSGCTLTYSFTMDIDSDWRDADAATLTEEGLEDALLRAEIEAVRELSWGIEYSEQSSAIINAIDTLNVGIADLTGAAGADELTKLAEMAASLMPAPRS